MAESKNSRGHSEGEDRSFKARGFPCCSERHDGFMYLHGWVLNVERYTTHACLKAFSTSHPTCLPFTYKGVLRDIGSTLSEILRTSGAL